jgi:hypothetical protein
MHDPASAYNICPQCGTEFGASDDTLTHTQLRSIWIQNGRRFWWYENQHNCLTAKSGPAGAHAPGESELLLSNTIREELTEALRKSAESFSDLRLADRDSLAEALAAVSEQSQRAEAAEHKVRALQLQFDAREQVVEFVQTLVSAMETCHTCKGLVLIDESPVHCEDCSSDCESHDEPNCTSIYELHRRLKQALSTSHEAMAHGGKR